MYGPRPAEQWKTVVWTNDPQRDRYGSCRKDGHNAALPGNQFPGSVSTSCKSQWWGWMEVKGKGGSGRGKWVEAELSRGRGA